MDALKKIFILTTSLVLAGIILWVIWTALSLFLVLGGFKMAKEIMNNTINKPPIVQQQKPTPKPKPKLTEAQKKRIAIKKAKEAEERRLSAEFENTYKSQDPKCKFNNTDYAYYCIQLKMDAKKKFMQENPIKVSVKTEYEIKKEKEAKAKRDAKRKAWLNKQYCELYKNNKEYQKENCN